MVYDSTNKADHPIIDNVEPSSEPRLDEGEKKEQNTRLDDVLSGAVNAAMSGVEQARDYIHEVTTSEEKDQQVKRDEAEEIRLKELKEKAEDNLEDAKERVTEAFENMRTRTADEFQSVKQAGLKRLDNAEKKVGESLKLPNEATTDTREEEKGKAATRQISMNENFLAVKEAAETRLDQAKERLEENWNATENTAADNRSVNEESKPSKGEAKATDSDNAVGNSEDSTRIFAAATEFAREKAENVKNTLEARNQTRNGDDSVASRSNKVVERENKTNDFDQSTAEYVDNAKQ